jgi:predicted 3-demethylubiquinone-9 3-methyltransferase (glyoxalase superfamily)
MTKVSTHLMFQNGTARAAMKLYQTVFPNFLVVSTENYGTDAGDAAGWIKTANVDFAGHPIMIIDSPAPHAFDFTPSMSLFVDFDTSAALDAAFAALSSPGKVMMPLGNYGFSERFGWVADKFGVSWQLNLA